MLNMDLETPNHLKIRRAPNGKFFITRETRAVCTRAGSLLYFEQERDALEFLAQIRDIAVH
jgi:hypothetical protein